MSILLDVILPVFVVIGFGYAMCGFGLANETLINSVKDFAQKFAVPFLLYSGVSNLDLGMFTSSGLIQTYYIAAFSCFGLGVLGARYLFGRAWEDSVVIGFTCLFSNTVLLGLPITERAFGTEALSYNFIIISVHSPLCYLVGISAMELARANSAQANWKSAVPQILRAMFSNSLVIGIAAGFTVNILDIPEPTVIAEAIDWMARAALPAALFSLGGTIYLLKIEGNLILVGFICLISLGLHPILVKLLSVPYGLSQEALRSALLTSSMAPGVNAFIFAEMYGRARRVAASSVLIGTIISIFTVWGWLGILYA